MELIKSHWEYKDINEFNDFVLTLKGTSSDCVWEQRIINTKLDCFGKTSGKAKILVKEIKKGNFYEFLDNVAITTLMHSLVFAFLLNEIRDFSLYEKYLDKLVLTIDNWATCDTLNFKKIDSVNLKNLSNKYLNNPHPFARRIGVNVYFELIKREGYIDDVFKVLNGLKNETEYYVNMASAWLLAECFVKHKEKTLEYFKNNNANPFIINKGISKIRDSFRVSKEDKDFLLRYKKQKIS